MAITSATRTTSPIKITAATLRDLQPETFDVPATMLDAQEGLLDLDEMNYELRAEQQAQDEMMAVPEDLMPELDLMMMDELPVAGGAEGWWCTDGGLVVQSEHTM